MTRILSSVTSGEQAIETIPQQTSYAKYKIVNTGRDFSLRTTKIQISSSSGRHLLVN